jgi:hypothetical protein
MKPDNLNQHITSGIYGGKTVPVPVRNVSRYGCQKSGYHNEADSPGKAANAHLVPHCKNVRLNMLDDLVFASKCDSFKFTKTSTNIEPVLT